MDQKEAFALKREHGAEHLLGTGVKFDRTRRITGYLVGSLERFNNAKRAEERERVKHGAGESVVSESETEEKRGRPRLFACCPECGGALSVTGTRQQGHVTNRWCVCAACGVQIRWVQAGEHGHWVRVRETNSPEIQKAPCV